MIEYYGDLTEDQTIDVYFNTFTSNDPSASSTITDFAAGDVHIHKDGGLTQRNNASGITVSIDFDGITGTHLIKIDTNDDTVVGFWVTGSDYMVRIEGTAVDGAVINVAVATFSIENRFNEVDLTHIMGTILTESGGSQLADAFTKLFDVATPLLVASDVMVGTDGANTTVPDAAGVAPTAIENRQEMDSNSTQLAAILNRIGNFAGTGLNTVKGFFQAMFRKDAGVTAGNTPSEINEIENTFTGNYDGATESNEAIGDRGDAEWATATGFNTTTPDVAGTAASLHSTTDGKVDAIQTDIGDFSGRTNDQSLLDVLGVPDVAGKDLTTLLVTDRLDNATFGLSALRNRGDAAWLTAAGFNTVVPPTKAEMDTAHALLATPAQVNTQMVDVMATDTHALPGQEAPPATPTYQEMLTYRYKQFRNKEEQTENEYSLYNNAGTVKDQKAVVSDDLTTATKEQMGSGA